LLALLNILAMNLVTAVIVETAFDEAQKDRRKVRRQRQGLLKKLVPDIQRLFHTMDKDGSGVLTRADLQDYDMIEVPDSLVSYLRIDNMEAIFELFDEDESDSITQQEFLQGFSCLVLSDSNMPPEAMVTFKMMKSTKRLTEEVHRWLRDQRR
jgi:Ca2+-binding EF-hand superfamily protein